MQYTAQLLALASAASAHYTFSGFYLNGEQQGTEWQYIREHTKGYMPTKGSEILADTFRCQPGAELGTNTQTIEVAAGDTVGFRQAFGADGIQHPGPSQVYMSKAPGSVSEYDGSGEWFKVYQSLLCSNPDNEQVLYGAWCSYDKDTIEFPMPELESGEYLVRVEHIGLHGAHEPDNTEFYFSCGQVSINGGSAGSSSGSTSSPAASASAAIPSSSSIPSWQNEDVSASEESTSEPDNCGNSWGGANNWSRLARRQTSGDMVSIPGVYDPADDFATFSLWDPAGIQEWPFIPGPDVISGGTTEGDSTGSGGGFRRVRRAMAPRHPRDFKN